MANLSGNARYNYEKIKNKIIEHYGEYHLCGNCKKMMECERMKVQNMPHKFKKTQLMKEKAPFVTHFEIEDMKTLPSDRGFVAVYECNNFEYEGF